MQGAPSFFPFRLAMLAGFALSGAAAPALAAAFNVNTQTDSHDITPGNGQCAGPGGKCSLRAALEESNALPAFPPAVITLPSGTYKLTLGSLEIKHSLSLNGASAISTIIDGNGGVQSGGPLGFSIVLISKGASPIVNISGVTIQNGGGGNTVFGTGLHVDDGTTLNLTNSVISGNTSAVGGVGIANSGFVSLLRSSVRDNVIEGGGGGVTGTGGGILSAKSGILRIVESTISSNIGIRGGGINNNGRLDIINSTISGNKASLGGGIENFGVLNISFSTITNNEAGRVTGEPRANYLGGGIRNFGELGGQVNIGNSILAGNRDGRTRFDPLFSPDCFSSDTDLFGITSFRGNLAGIINANCNLSDTIFGGTPFDQVGSPTAPLDPRLGPLADNGGPTQTHALQGDSPAIDHGTGVTSSAFFDCPETDQRGGPRAGTRATGPACDVGAFEYASPWR
jgi:hypothetical protein